MNLELLKNSLSTVQHIFSHTPPTLTIVLGSGWGEVIKSLNVLHSIDYSDIPVMRQSQIRGHAGKLLLLDNSGKHVLVFQGRHHWYQGIGWDPIAFPVFLTNELGISSILLTNAAGSLSPSLKPGTLMIIDDHINAMSSTPLWGQYDDYWGPRFPDQSHIYNEDLRIALHSACKETEVVFHHGIYAAKDGPVYETPAEVTALQLAGASAVGMSTVPEAILANSLGIKTAGLSCITNFAAGIGTSTLSHEEVLTQTARTMPLMASVIEKTLLAIK